MLTVAISHRQEQLYAPQVLSSPKKSELSFHFVVKSQFARSKSTVHNKWNKCVCVCVGAGVICAGCSVMSYTFRKLIYSDSISAPLPHAVVPDACHSCRTQLSRCRNGMRVKMLRKRRQYMVRCRVARASHNRFVFIEMTSVCATAGMETMRSNQHK